MTAVAANMDMTSINIPTTYATSDALRMSVSVVRLNCGWKCTSMSRRTINISSTIPHNVKYNVSRFDMVSSVLTIFSNSMRSSASSGLSHLDSPLGVPSRLCSR